MDHDDRIGLVLQDRYKILSRIADGGMGVVYRGERIRLGKPVAVKFLHAEYAIKQDFVRRFEVEAKAMSRISHPHCASVLDFGTDHDTPYLVMDYVTGETLRELLTHGPVTPPRAIEIIRQTLAGLAHAHSVGIVHRDVKPENIVLSASEGFGDHVRILDFGFAKLRASADDSSLSRGFAVGTPSYMAPEVSKGEGVDARADVYATGVVLFELITGRKPFLRDQAIDIIRAHQKEPPPRLGEMMGTVYSNRLENAVARALAKDPKERFQTAAEFATALARTPEARPPVTEASYPAVAPPSPTTLPPADLRTPTGVQALTGPMMRPRLWVLVGVLAIMAFAVVLWQVTRDDARGDDVVPSPPAARMPEPMPPPTPTAPAPRYGSTIPPENVPGIEDVYALIDEGKKDEAIRALQSHRQLRPKSAYVVYLLGNLFFEKQWWNDGFNAYDQVVKLNGDYRHDPVLIKNVVRTLSSPKASARGQAFLIRLGKPALPTLREGAGGTTSVQTRTRLAYVIKRIEAQP